MHFTIAIELFTKLQQRCQSASSPMPPATGANSPTNPAQGLRHSSDTDKTLTGSTVPGVNLIGIR